MKIAIIFVGLLVVIAMFVNGNVLLDKVARNIEKCAAKLKTSKDVMESVMSMDGFDSRPASCLIDCVMKEMHMLKNRKFNMTEVLDDFNKTNGVTAKQKEKMAQFVNACAQHAQKVKGKCAAAGAMAQCLRQLFHDDD